jgi:hypothetical protein
LVPYSDSVYKAPKTYFNLLLLKTATREEEKLLSIGNSKEKREGFMVSPVLHSGVFRLLQMNRREFQVYQEEQGRRRRRRPRRKDCEGLFIGEP